MEGCALIEGRAAAQRLLDGDRARRRGEAQIIEALCDLAECYRLDEDELTEVLVERRVQVGGEGTPSVSEHLRLEIAGLLGCTPPAATGRLADALNLKHRHPRLYEAVQRLELDAGRALKAAARCAHLHPVHADSVTNQWCRRQAGLGWTAAFNLLDKLIIAVDAKLAAEREQKAREDRGVWTWGLFEGVMNLTGRLDVLDARLLDERLDQVAALLEPTFPTLTASQRRAKALAVLVDPHQAVALLDAAPQPELIDALLDEAVAGAHLPCRCRRCTSVGAGVGAPGEALPDRPVPVASAGGAARWSGEVTGVAAAALPTNPVAAPAGSACRPTGAGPRGAGADVAAQPVSAHGGFDFPRSGASGPAHQASVRGAGPERSADRPVVSLPGRTLPGPGSEPATCQPGCPGIRSGAVGDSATGPDDEPAGLDDGRGGSRTAAHLPGELVGEPSAGSHPSRGRGSAKAGRAPGRRQPVLQVAVHLHADSFGELSPVARVERAGHITTALLRELLGEASFDVRVQPVIDLPRFAPADRYVPTHRMRRAVTLAFPVEPFPFSNRSTGSLDQDHTVAYRPGVAGQTRIGNLAPLSRGVHRAKTAGFWVLDQPSPGQLVWTSPLGYAYDVTPYGSRRRTTTPT